MAEYLLPRFSNNAITGHLSQGKTNPSLLFYCYLDGSQSKKRTETLQTFIDKVDLSMTGICCKRHLASMDQLRGRYGQKSVKGEVMTLSDRMVVGMGHSSSFENGLLLHRIHGFPYINGEALKGAARSYASETIGDDKDKREKFVRIFGSWGKGESESKGKVTFFDALPIKAGSLFSVDIINCHYGEYYLADNPLPPPEPGDWMDPNPVNFLTVKKGTAFDFHLAVKSESKAELLDQAWQWLEGALVRRGIGAKRRIGYGHFCKKQGAFLSVKAYDDSLSPVEREIRTTAAKNIAGKAATFVEKIAKMDAGKERMRAALALRDKLSNKTLKEKKDKAWMKTLMSILVPA